MTVPLVDELLDQQNQKSPVSSSPESVSFRRPDQQNHVSPVSSPDSVSFSRPVTSSRILSDESLTEVELPRNSTEIVPVPVPIVNLPPTVLESTQSNK